jgi:YVTN family beta-propeller protein
LVASWAHPARDHAPHRPNSRGSASGGLAISVANVTVGHFPQNATFDPANGLVYVANSYSDNVSVLNGTTLAGSVNVGDLPAAITYDGADGAVDVLNQLSANVSVLNGSGLVATVPVGNSSNQAYNPEGMAYDPANGFVYVPNTNPGTVSVLNGSTVVATLVVGSSPTFATFDPGNGFVYITDLGGSVTVLNGTTMVRIVGVGASPGVPAVGPGGELYVPNYADSNLSVLNGTRVVATLAVRGEDFFATFDPIHGYVDLSPEYGGPNDNVTVVNATSVVATVGGGSSPAEGTFDPGDGLVYLPNAGNNRHYGPDTVRVLDGTSILATLPVGTSPVDATFDARDGCVDTVNFGSDNVTVLCPVRDRSANFSESGLPAGANWSVAFDGIPSLGPGPFSFGSLAAGLYSYSILPSGGYVPTPREGTANTTGTNSSVLVTFALPVPANYSVAFAETGLPSGTFWSVTLNGSSQSSTSGGIAFQRPNGTYPYSIGPVAGFVASTWNASVVVAGTSKNVTISWLPNEYPVTFTEEGLTVGLPWTVSCNGATQLTNASSVVCGSTNGTLAYAVGGIPGWTTSNFNGLAVVAGAPVPVAVPWSVMEYSLTFTETGLPAGSTWSVSVGGTPWYSTTGRIALSEPNASYTFTVTAPSGFGASPSQGTAVVDGSLATESISFAAVTHGTQSPATPAWGPEWGLGILGGGVVLGAALGLWYWRRRVGPPHS